MGSMHDSVGRSAEGSDGHHRHKFNTVISHDDRKLYGRIEIEHAIEGRALDEATFAQYLTAYSNETGEIAPEEFVEEIYHKIVGDVFPGYAARDEPWESAPLVVAYEYGSGTGSTKHTVTLGSYL